MVVVEGSFHPMVEVAEDCHLFHVNFSLIYVVSFFVSEIFLEENRIFTKLSLLFFIQLPS